MKNRISEYLEEKKSAYPLTWIPNEEDSRRLAIEISGILLVSLLDNKSYLKVYDLQKDPEEVATASVYFCLLMIKLSSEITKMNGGEFFLNLSTCLSANVTACLSGYSILLNFKKS